jgi:DNA-binding GntR family transcriptional regulator
MAHDPDDKRPLFERVVADVRAQIMSGELTADMKVPPARELAERFGIANMTAQRALRELQNQGLIYGVPGKGSFVHPNAFHRLFPDEGPIATIADYAETREHTEQMVARMFEGLDAAIETGSMENVIEARNELLVLYLHLHRLISGMAEYEHRFPQVVEQYEAEHGSKKP